MDMFVRHKLVRQHSGYTVVLYLEQQPGEFSNELLLSIDTKRKTIQKNTADYIKSYIDKNLPGIRVNAVKVMVGSLLVASLPFSSLVNASARNSSFPVSQTQQSATYTGKAVLRKQKSKNAAQMVLKSGGYIMVQNPASITAIINKTRHLSAAYKPQSLVVPNVPFPFSGYNPKMLMRQDAAKALEQLFAAARRDHVNLYAVSGYRSYEVQKSIFTYNTKKYGSAAAANRVSARPGESEHQSGLAMDVSSPSVNFQLTESFANTREGKWLK